MPGGFLTNKSSKDPKKWGERFVGRVESSLRILEGTLTVSNYASTTHSAVAVTGWNGDANAEKAISEYLVALRMIMVSHVLQVRADLLGSVVDETPRIIQNVEKIIGQEGQVLNDKQIREERNPWIAEALWHLCLNLAARVTAISLPGTVVALSQPHSFAKETGLDCAALYRTAAGSFGLAIVETKAYEKAPNKAISDAIKMFKAIDSDRMDVEIRRDVMAMRAELTPSDQAKITQALWQDERTYIPNPHYDSSHRKDWSSKRPAFGGLAVDADRVIVMPNELDGFLGFFDRISSGMREFARELQDV